MRRQRASARPQFDDAAWEAAIAAAVAPSPMQKALLMSFKIPMEMIESLEFKSDAHKYLSVLIDRSYRFNSQVPFDSSDIFSPMNGRFRISSTCAKGRYFQAL